MENPKTEDGRLDLSKERYDQSTFLGRYKHFSTTCNPFTLFTSEKDLLKAQDIVERYKKGEDVNLSDEKIWHQKALVDSAFHPVTETIIPHVGRMSAQCPVNALLAGAMMTFYKTRKEVVFWQWVNQSVNAYVNQMNSSDPRIEWKDASKTYAMAVGSALPVSIVISEIASKMGPIAQRLVPLFSVAMANALNIPLCRQKELKEGIQLWHGQREIGKSKKMAVYAICTVLISRTLMQIPHMLSLPILMPKMASFFDKNPKLAVPFQVSVCLLSLFFSVPTGCALFPHKVHVPISSLEPEVQEDIRHKRSPPANSVYFNKGL